MESAIIPPCPAAVAVPDHGELTSRATYEPAHAYRPAFSRDAARLLHARAFRRLAGKTQVFARQNSQNLSDHFRSRLTHTLEVAQISRTTAAALGLNATLAEALALAHDIGHPPFGHAGERALDKALQQHNLRFDHNLHALRIVTWFEEHSPAWPGLNLTLGLREGIIKHSRDYTAAEHPELEAYFLGSFPPLEAQLIDLTDEIAYLTADLDDGLSSGLLSLDAVRLELAPFRDLEEEVRRSYPSATPKLRVMEALKRLLDRWVTGLIHETSRLVAEFDITNLEELRHAPRRLAALPPALEQERRQVKEFLYARLYLSPQMEEAHRHAEGVVGELFTYCCAHPGLLPPDHQAQIESEGLARTVADYIAGMTDRYIEQLWRTHCA